MGRADVLMISLGQGRMHAVELGRGTPSDGEKKCDTLSSVCCKTRRMKSKKSTQNEPPVPSTLIFPHERRLVKVSSENPSEKRTEERS